ncbi:MAG: DNA polymerase III subunit delta [Candidatus Uhrbacteria bacterium]
MLIFVYGEDTFRVREKVKVMKKKFIEKFDKSGMNLAEFLNKLELGQVMQAVQSPPFLGDKRMVVVRDLCGSLKKDQIEDWQNGLSKTSESTIVVLWEEMDPKKLEKHVLYKGLSKQSEVHSYPFPLLQGAELTRWVVARVTEMGARINQDALQSLVERVGSDLWQMQHELEKLVAYSGKTIITIEMVEKLVRASFEDQIFQLVDAISHRNVDQAIRLLEEERWSGATDQYIFGMLARQVRILLGTRSVLDFNPNTTKDLVAAELSLHPFVAQKAIGQAWSFETADLVRAHALLFEIDQATKKGRLGSELAVDLVVAEMLS